MAARLVLVALAVLVAAAAGYLASLQLHPWTPCKPCDGKGKTGDPVWKQAHGTCPACGGKGRHPRLGVRVLQPGRYRRLAGRRVSHKSVDQRGNP